MDKKTWQQPVVTKVLVKGATFGSGPTFESDACGEGFSPVGCSL